MNTLSLDDYREFVRGCIHPGVTPNNLKLYAQLGYEAEVGEAKQVLSKALRSVQADQEMPEDRWQQFVLECSDILFYATILEMLDDEVRPAITVLRHYHVKTLANILRDAEPTFLAVLPNMSIEQLAYINQQKLLARREQIGTFAKP